MFVVYANGVKLGGGFKTRKDANEWVRRTKRINEGLRQTYGAYIAPISTYNVREEA